MKTKRIFAWSPCFLGRRQVQCVPSVCVMYPPPQTHVGRVSKVFMGRRWDDDFIFSSLFFQECVSRRNLAGFPGSSQGARLWCKVLFYYFIGSEIYSLWLNGALRLRDLFG